MCAINGVTARRREVVLGMNMATKQRGPDGTDVWEGEGITLGHNRLAVIDLSDAGKQPMHSADGRYVITYNGELYNYREIRNELQNEYNFVTQSDTEVLLYAYVKWGTNMFDRLRGIFAFGIWDNQNQSLVLARDHMGVKPLYFFEQSGVIFFSSELAGIFAVLETAQLDSFGTSLYLSIQYSPSPHTLVRGVQKLPAGHYLVFADRKSTITQYFKTDFTKKDIRPETIYDTIDSVVHRQMVSDRPIGAFLSGGIDSSVVLHHMSKHSDNVRTYSVGFEMVVGAEAEKEKFNADAELAAMTASHYGATHKTLTISISDVRRELQRILENIDEPVANPTAISQYLLSRWVRDDGVVVALGGDGGDELFGGYTRHKIAIGAYLFQKLPNLVQKSIKKFYPRIGKLSQPFFTPLYLEFVAKDEKVLQKILGASLQPTASAEIFFKSLETEISADLHPMDTFMKIDRSRWLADESFARSDRASMAHGLEYRVPLSDVDVVAIADHIPIWQKTLPHQGKRILRKTYRKHLPAYLFDQQKRGWISPGAKWFRDPVINKFMAEVFSSTYYSGLDNLFNWDTVREMFKDHREKRGYYLLPLWNILQLQIWAQKHKIQFTE